LNLAGPDVRKWTQSGGYKLVFGIDPDVEAVSRANERIRQAGLLNIYQCVAAEDPAQVIWTLPEGFFDVCSSFFCLHLVPNLAAALGAIARVLKSGGKLIGTIPDSDRVSRLPVGDGPAFMLADGRCRFQLPPKSPYAARIGTQHVDEPALRGATLIQAADAAGFYLDFVGPFNSVVPVPSGLTQDDFALSSCYTAFCFFKK
tara:strand:+ start:2671 stop:3276 length:606 start_codon:yes stop_codon:yes gene_type:complete